eukprot:gene12874-27150_t
MISAVSNRSSGGRNVFTENEIETITTDPSETVNIFYVSGRKHDEKYSNLKIIVVIIDGVASAAGSILMNYFSMSLCGRFEGISGKNYANIYTSPDENRMVIQILNTLPGNTSFQLAGQIGSFGSPLTVILDAVSSSSIRSNSLSSESLLRALQTKAVQSDISPILHGVQRLGIGTVVSGLSAALLSYYEIRDIPAVVFLAIREPAYTIESSRSFETIWPLLQQYFEDNKLPLPTRSDYLATLKSDRFLMNTEN